jgi:cobalt-precorrin 5A hydrolase
MDLGEAVIMAGIGCRRGTSAEEVRAAIDAALSAHDLRPDDIAALAAPQEKAEEAGIHQAARSLDLTVIVISRPQLAQEAGRTLSQSRASIAATGVPSASEAAALAAIGSGGRLLGPRIVVGPVTCALATDGTTP